MTGPSRGSTSSTSQISCLEGLAQQREGAVQPVATPAVALVVRLGGDVADQLVEMVLGRREDNDAVVRRLGGEDQAARTPSRGGGDREGRR